MSIEEILKIDSNEYVIESDILARWAILLYYENQMNKLYGDL